MSLPPAVVIRRGAEYLARRDVASPLPEAERLMMHVLDAGRAEVYARGDGLTAAEARTYGRLLCRRCVGTPLQQLTGEQGFRRLVLEVRPGVFVPRPETEVVVEIALAAIDGHASPIVVDVGTGTGAIALAIVDEHPGARVCAIDRSPEAVALAQANAARLCLDVDVVTGDLMEGVPDDLRGEVDLVVSNPPYVPADREAELPAEVRADPPSAVFGDVDLLARLGEQARSWLRPGGALVVEIDDAAPSASTDAIEQLGFCEVGLDVDLAGRPRVLSARRP